MRFEFIFEIYCIELRDMYYITALKNICIVITAYTCREMNLILFCTERIAKIAQL